MNIHQTPLPLLKCLFRCAHQQRKVPMHKCISCRTQLYYSSVILFLEPDLPADLPRHISRLPHAKYIQHYRPLKFDLSTNPTDICISSNWIYPQVFSAFREVVRCYQHYTKPSWYQMQYISKLYLGTLLLKSCRKDSQPFQADSPRCKEGNPILV